jgi:hypothetical protein
MPAHLLFYALKWQLFYEGFEFTYLKGHIEGIANKTMTEIAPKAGRTGAKP